MALVAVNRFDRTAEVFACAGFHFDKDERVVVAANDIDLAALAAMEIAVQNFITLLAQEFARELFAAAPTTQMLRFR